MSHRLEPLAPVHCMVAAALHALSGLPQPWDAAAFADLIALPGVCGLLALDAADPTGLILWRVAADEAEILTLCVHPLARRSGLGRTLLAHASAASRDAGAKSLYLEVSTDNAPARALYEGSGFRIRGRRPRYYETECGPVDALVLSAEL